MTRSRDTFRHNAKIHSDKMLNRPHIKTYLATNEHSIFDQGIEGLNSANRQYHSLGIEQKRQSLKLGDQPSTSVFSTQDILPWLYRWADSHHRIARRGRSYYRHSSGTSRKNHHGREPQPGMLHETGQQCTWAESWFLA